MLKKQLSGVLLLVFVFSASAVFAKVVKKAAVHRLGSREYIFLQDGEEVARQIVDEVSGEVVKITGSIPDGIIHEYNSDGRLWYAWFYKGGLTMRSL